MSEEWKDLEIDNLPPDILVGDYEWQISQGDGWESARAEENVDFRIIALQDIKSKKTFKVDDDEDVLLPVQYRFRPRPPKPPSHEEIMTKWWFDKSGNWEKVTGYAPSEQYTKYRLHNLWVAKEYFHDLYSVDIPPEEIE